jgi:acetyl esterase/lipase
MNTARDIEITSRMECGSFVRIGHFPRSGTFLLVVAATILIGAGPDAVPVRSTTRTTSDADRSLVHKSVTRHNCGIGAQSYWLFEPDAPRPERAPVLVFLHGWMVVNPGVYGAWIDHLVRRGTIVIYPRFQADWATHPAEFFPNVRSSVRDALGVLRTAPGHVRPDDRRFALIGHSVGADLAVHLSAMAGDVRLPEPRALILLMPGRLDAVHKPEPRAIPAGTLLVVAVADRDQIVGDDLAREIFDGAVGIPMERKRYVVYRSDLRGRRPLIANHMAPTASLPLFDTGEGPFHSLQMAQAKVDTLDRLGLWRLGDLVLEAGFAARTFEDATLHGRLLLDLGRWEDGQPITAPIISASPSGLPRLPPSLNARVLPQVLRPSPGPPHRGKKDTSRRTPPG